MRSEQLAPLDMAFLSLEQDATPMHMGAVAVFQPASSADTDRLAALLAARARRLPMLRRTVQWRWLPPGTALWSDDPAFSEDRHIHRHHLPAPGAREQLSELVAELMSEPMDLRRPLWELHVITGLDGDRFAVLSKLHHALCDGAGAVMLGMGLLDGFTPPEPPEPDAQPNASWLARAGWRVLRQPNDLTGTARRLASEFSTGLASAVRQRREAFGIARDIVREARLPHRGSPLLSTPRRQRRVELLQLALTDIRQVRRRHGGTTNDVLLTVVAGALRRWLTARGHPLDDLEPRALVPVSQRRRSGAGGNQLSGSLCPLPVGEADPVRRLRAIRAAMDSNKNAGLSHGPGALPILAEQLPRLAHAVATPWAGRTAALLFDTVITNVPLPRLTFSLDSATLQEMYPLVPLAPGHALGIALSTYGDTVQVGLQANRDAMPDIEKLSEAVPIALAELGDVPS